MYTRELKAPSRAFFLFGPRSTGKTTWTCEAYPDAFIVDLLTARESLRYSKDPSLLRAQVCALPKNKWIVIDEIQRVPALLDEVHSLMENEGYKRFVLSGSSARKLKRGGANLLAGRAVTRNLYPFTSEEVNYELRPRNVLRFGMLPLSYTARNNSEREDFLRSYVTTYLSQEIRAEGLVRNIGDFARFLEIAALVAGSRPNISGLARDAGIGRDTVQGYFSVFEDTLLGSWLPAYRPRSKVKEVASPKFYWFDPGVLNAAAGGFDQPLPSDWDGILLEHWIFAELRAFLDYNGIRGTLGFWSTPSGSEVDFLHWYGKRAVAIEVKHANSFRKEYLKGIKSLSENMSLEKSVVVYLGSEELLIDGTSILPVEKFLKLLHSGKIING